MHEKVIQAHNVISTRNNVCIYFENVSSLHCNQVNVPINRNVLQKGMEFESHAHQQKEMWNDHASYVQVATS